MSDDEFISEHVKEMIKIRERNGYVPQDKRERKEEASDLKIRYIPIKSIRLNNFNVNQLSASTFEDLRTSVMMHGLKQPLTVRPLPDEYGEKFFELVDGQHRMLIIKEEGDRFADKFGESVPCIVSEMDESEAEKTVFLLTHTRGEYNQGKGSSLFEGREEELAKFTGINPLKIRTYTSPPVLFRDSKEVSDSILQYMTLHAYSEEFLNMITELAKDISPEYYEKDGRMVYSCMFSAMIKDAVIRMKSDQSFRSKISNSALSLKRTYDDVFRQNIISIRIRKLSEVLPTSVEEAWNAKAKCRICEKKGCAVIERFEYAESKCFLCADCHRLLSSARAKKRQDLRNVNENEKRIKGIFRNVK